jgi:MraZ protein
MATLSKQAKTGENPSGTEVGRGGEVGGGGGSGGGAGRAASSGDDEIYYLGKYTHGSDEKKRVQIPSKWRPENLTNYEVNVVLWMRESESEACLQVFPPGEMKRLMQLVRNKSWGDADAETLRRRLGGDSETVKVDSVGRVCIPDRLAKPAGIEKNSEVLLVGMVDVYQIWNTERYKTTQSKDVVTMPQALALLKSNESESK